MRKLFSFESVDYQTNDFFVEEAGKLLDDIKTKIENVTYINNYDVMRSKEIKKLEELTRQRFNIAFDFHMEYWTECPAGIFIVHDAFLNSPHLQTESSLKNLTKQNVTSLIKQYELVLNKFKNKEGYIDKRKAKVYGYFSEIPLMAMFDFFTLFKTIGLTGKEALAVLMHEIGHAFVGFEHHYSLLTGNLVLRDFIDGINKKDYKTVTYILSNQFNIKDFNPMDIENSDKVVDIATKVSKAYLLNQESELLNNLYDLNSVESGADDFASRFMLQKELALALTKLDRVIEKVYNPSGSQHSTTYAIFNFVMYSILYPLLLIVFTAGAVIVVYLVYKFIDYFAGLFIPEGGKVKRDIHETPPERLKRIMLNLINAVKKTNPPKIVFDQYYNDYLLIMELIKEVDKFVYFRDYSSFGSLFEGKDEKYVKIQRIIEEWVNNPLNMEIHRFKLA